MQITHFLKMSFCQKIKVINVYTVVFLIQLTRVKIRVKCKPPEISLYSILFL